MKAILSLFLLLGTFFISFPLSAQNVISDATKDLLSILDEAVKHKMVYRGQREQLLTQQKEKAAQLQGVEKQQAYYLIFKNYARYQTDSAVVYLDKLAHTPPFSEQLSNRIKIGHAEIYAVTGSYASAEEYFQQIDARSLNKEMSLEYYHLNRTLYGWMADFSIQPETRRKMKQLTDNYRDSILRHEPPGINYNIVKADSANVNNRPELALSICINDTANAHKNELPYIYYNMSVAYQQMNNVDLQMFYLAQTALADIKNGTTEYEALPRLAQLCYEQHDLDRAYLYLVCSIEDASYCKARLRTIEASSIFPIIDHAYKEQVDQRDRMMHIFIYTLCVLALLLFIVVFYLRQQMLRLSSTRKELALANEKLQGSNQDLIATDKVKEEYIARYLDRCRDYIDALEQFRRNLLKLFKGHQMDELYKELKSEETVRSEQERFLEEFDSTFLNIHPHFVKDFNALLQPDAQIQPKAKETLNTELRIFALIRLGVTDSQRIAHFLNYSVATVYSYRSKIRNKAIGDKTKFEEAVMNL